VKKLSTLALICILMMLLNACSKEESVASQPPQPTQPTTPAQPTQPQAAPAEKSGTSGTVVETMDAGGYTYVQVDDGANKIWAAAPQFDVKVGDQVIVPQGMEMMNYHSKTLNRDFSSVYFVESVLNASSPAMPKQLNKPQIPEGHPPITAAAPTPEMDFSTLKKAEAGKTIAEIYADKAQLAGKEILLRAKVVKFSPQIMGTNWLHLQDGTGKAAEQNHDLAVTGAAQVKPGDTVLVKGVLSLDKDFGYGYKYALIVENADISIE